MLAVDASLIDLIEDYRHKRKKSKESNNADNILADADLPSDLSVDSNDLSNGYAEEDLEDDEIVYKYKLSFKEILLYAITDLNIIVAFLPILFFIIGFLLEASSLFGKVPDEVNTAIDNFFAKELGL